MRKPTNGALRTILIGVAVAVVAGIVAFAGNAVTERVSHNERLHCRNASVDSLQTVQIVKLEHRMDDADIERKQTLRLTLLIAEQLEVPKTKIEAALLSPDSADSN